jgi:hypothetical protein
MDWGWNLAIVFSTIAGPILAVQAQRWIDVRRDRDRRRLFVFHTLMRLRASPLAGDFVSALNSVPLEFNGKGAKLSAVRSAWKVYMDHLGKSITGDSWFTRRIDLLTDLLRKMGDFLGYSFDPVELEREVYSPVAHGELETEQTIIRKGLVAMFNGERSLPVEVTVAHSPQAPMAVKSGQNS